MCDGGLSRRSALCVFLSSGVAGYAPATGTANACGPATITAPIDDTAIDGTAIDDAPVDDTPVDDAPVDDAPVDDAPVDDASIDDAPVDDASIDDAPEDDAPADDAREDDGPSDEARKGAPADPPSPLGPEPVSDASDQDVPGGTPDATAAPVVPDRLPVLQQAGWWTIFGAFAVGTAAGVFSGLAERQEDKAVRLASRFDLDGGSQTLYADDQEEYESILDRGQRFETTAIALGAISGAVAIAGITLFIVDARRSKRRPRQRARLGPAGVEVRF